MNLRKGLVAAAVATGVAVGATACGPGYQPQADYCVDSAGHVVPANYCQPSYPMYGNYFVYVGYVHGHSYGVGQVIPRSYISSGRQYRANDTVARQKAGIPVTSSFTNGSTKASKSATSQPSPKSTPVKPPVTTTKTDPTSGTTVNRTTPRPSGGFSSSTRTSGTGGVFHSIEHRPEVVSHGLD